MPRWPALIGTNCGTVEVRADGVTLYYGGAVACFAKAYQTCQAATLLFTRPIPGFAPSPPPPTETHFISFQSQNGLCAVSDVVERPSARPDMLYTLYPCAELQPQPNGRLIVSRCGAEGDLDILVSPPSAPTAT